MGQDSSQTGQADYYLAQVSSASLYYPFGWEMPGRKFVSGEEYRFGFNGQEEDPDIHGGGIVFKYRTEDARVARFFAVDPIAYDYPELTPYQVASNSPIGMIEYEGLEGVGVLRIPRFLINVPRVSLPKMPAPPVLPPVPVAPPIPPSLVQPQAPVAPEVPHELKVEPIDWENAPPADPSELSEEWEEITHPENKSGKHRDFKNKNTGEEIRFDKGNPKQKGFKAKDHWHRKNPNKTNKRDAYLDKYGNPVGRHSDASHIMPSGPPAVVRPTTANKIEDVINYYIKKEKYDRAVKKREKALKKYEKAQEKYEKALEKYWEDRGII